MHTRIQVQLALFVGVPMAQASGNTRFHFSQARQQLRTRLFCIASPYVCSIDALTKPHAMTSAWHSFLAHRHSCNELYRTTYSHSTRNWPDAQALLPG